MSSEFDFQQEVLGDELEVETDDASESSLHVNEVRCDQNVMIMVRETQLSPTDNWSYLLNEVNTHQSELLSKNSREMHRYLDNIEKWSIRSAK